ncbi:MAG: UDP-N-acetylglucosamine 2-epimerase (non-hydrolyzing) [Thaumarchaeota archaeon]|nr:UDP-N-acetylglucosamine 2-epimerase (non-hydrolyzing) [Nitrososphaerota archaeon]
MLSRICLIFGTRPEIIKLSPIIRRARKRNIQTIFTGQHYDYDLGLKFIEDLDLPSPNYKMELTKNNSAMQMGEIITKLSKILQEIKTDTVMVQGDTNTVLAGAISALKSKIPLSHVESGLRSFDWRMPEEHNRILADHISELLFASTNTSRQNLVNEHVHGKIFVVGNTAIDALEQNLSIAEKKSSINIDGEFSLLTLHRAENVDYKKTLSDIINGIIRSGERFVFPVHPRTKKRLSEFRLYEKIKESKNIIMTDAVGYFDIILLMKRCRLIVTDSGGIQEEATSPKIRKKVLIARTSTDRPEAVEAGLSEIIGTNSDYIKKAIIRAINSPWHHKGNSPYGNGKTTEKILKITDKYF